MNDVAFANGNYQGRPPIRAVLDLHALALTTPAYRASQTSRDAFPTWVVAGEAEASFDWNDWHRQLEAMLVHDVTKPYGGTMEAAAKRVKARAMGSTAQVVALEGPCGHLAPSCEGAKLSAAVLSFLAASQRP